MASTMAALMPTTATNSPKLSEPSTSDNPYAHEKCPTHNVTWGKCRCMVPTVYIRNTKEEKVSADGLFAYNLIICEGRYYGQAPYRGESGEVYAYLGNAEYIAIPEKIDGVAVRKVILDGAYTAKEIVVEGGADVYITSWRMPNLTDIWAMNADECYLFCAEIYGEDGETERAALSRPTVHMRKDRKDDIRLCLGEGPTVNYKTNAAESTVDIGYYAGNFDETILTSDSNTQELLEWEAGWQTRDFERLGLPYKGQKCYSDQAIVIHTWQYVIDEEGEIVWELPQHARYNCEISFE